VPQRFAAARREGAGSPGCLLRALSIPTHPHPEHT
jgi:hypothetical protein